MHTESIYENLFKTSLRTTAELLSPVRTDLAAGAHVVLVDTQTVMLFFYKRNFWGFRGEEFDPKDVKIIFEGGSKLGFQISCKGLLPPLEMMQV